MEGKLDLLDETVQEVRSFIDERFELIKRDKGMVQLRNKGNAIIVHLVPLADFRDNEKHKNLNLDMLSLHVSPLGYHLLPMKYHEFTRTENGYLGSYSNESCCSYTHVFHNGMIESVFDNYKIQPNNQTNGHITSSFILDMDLYRIILEATERNLSFLEHIFANTPIFLQVSLFGVENLQLITTLNERGIIGNSFRRNEYQLNPTIVETYNKEKNYKRPIKKLFLQILKIVGDNKFPEELYRPSTRAYIYL